jgi:Fe-S cluster biogenesis protein NfuA
MSKVYPLCVVISFSWVQRSNGSIKLVYSGACKGHVSSVSLTALLKNVVEITAVQFTLALNNLI